MVQQLESFPVLVDGLIVPGAELKGHDGVVARVEGNDSFSGVLQYLGIRRKVGLRVESYSMSGIVCSGIRIWTREHTLFPFMWLTWTRGAPVQ